MRSRFCLLLVLAQIMLTPVLAAQETPASDNVPRVAQAADSAYLNPDLPIAERMEDLLARMVLDEKIGQMTLVEKNSIFPEDIAALGIGGLLSGGGGYPVNNNPESWAEMVDGLQRLALQSRLRIPLIYGVDAVHGHNNVVGTVIFPHNIGLGAANNPELMGEIGHITAIETVATGIYWNYAPVVAVVRDIRWGRTYESYGEDTDLVTTLGTAYLVGMQGDDLAAPDTILGTPKHFIGDGGTGWMTSQTPGYFIDQGDTRVDEETLRDVFLPPYIAAVENGAQSIMVSFSSWNGVKMHAQRYLITDVLKGELGFDGFVVSDWAGIDQVSPDYYQAVVTAINAGIDMNMVPYDYRRFIDTMKTATSRWNGSMTPCAASSR
jgi:beta-glucosidase